MERPVCLWCDKELTKEESKRGDLCLACEQVSSGIPELSEETLDKLPFGVIHLSRDGTILAFNNAESRLSGLASKKVIGRNFFNEIAPCADVQEFRQRFSEFLDGENLSAHFTYTYQFRPKPTTVQITFLRVNQQLAFVLSKRT